jgi:hypothetical protein
MPPDTIPTTDTKPPRCAMCRARTALVGVAAAPDGSEKHSYHCAKCGFSKSKIIGGSADTGHRRPPKKRS